MAQAVGQVDGQRRKANQMNTAFETWWREEGSGITPNPGADMEEHAKRVCEIAWKRVMCLGDGCFEDAPRYAELERPEYPDLRLAVWALLKRLKAIQVAACVEPGNDPLINNCEHALNGWQPPHAVQATDGTA